MRFWQDLEKVTNVALVDKLLVGRNSDGSSVYMDVQTLYDRIAQTYFVDTKPSVIAVGSVLTNPNSLTCFIAPAGTYTLPVGTITLSGNLNLIFWDFDNGWTYSSFDVAVKDNTVSTSKIVDLAVTTAKIADGAVSEEKTTFIAATQNAQAYWGVKIGDRVPILIDKDFNIDGGGLSQRLVKSISQTIVPLIESELFSIFEPQIKSEIGYESTQNAQAYWGVKIGDRMPIFIDKDFNIDGGGLSERLIKAISQTIVPFIESELFSIFEPQIKSEIGYESTQNAQAYWGVKIGDRMPIFIDKDFNIDGGGLSERLLNYIVSNTPIDGITEVINRDKPYVIQQWGDSLTAMTGMLEKVVALAGSEFTAMNCGVSGESASTIASRNGGVPCIVTQSFTIPSDVTEVEISSVANIRLRSVKNNTSIRPLQQGHGNSVNPVFINDIECTMRYDTPTETWYIKRNAVGSDTLVSENTIIQFSGAYLRKNAYVNIYFIGQNGGYSTDAELVDIIADMVAFNASKNFIVLGLHTGTASARANLEALCLQKFGMRYINTRKYISSLQAFVDANIEPTSEDLSAISDGTFPPSFWYSPTDSVHFNTIGRELVGTKIYNRLKQLGTF